MNQNKYSLGLDFGTASVRCLAVNISSGEEKAIAVSEYSDGVISKNLPSTSVVLPSNWALQNPHDWLNGLKDVVRRTLIAGKISPEQVIGLGVCFTSCTVLPTTEDGTPLCFLPEWVAEPHAWPKLWKHHSAQPQADLINELAKAKNESWLKRYGGLISSEWLFPKILQVYQESPKCFNAAKRFIEGGDWLIWKLSGREMRSACQAGYKGLWNFQEGYPSLEFLENLSEGFGEVEKKLCDKVHPVGICAGSLSSEMASQLNLHQNTTVSTSVIDAHAALVGSGINSPGKMLMVMGTSTCHIVISKKEVFMEGVAGVVRDGILPGYYGYESGQSAVGDIFAWAINYGVPERYYKESEDLGISLHELLIRKSADQIIGGHGLLALDWFNGNRSVLMNSNLSGLFLGLTLNTKPEDIYRAMIEATAFGTKIIINGYQDNGVKIKELVACGGLTNNKYLLKIYSDVIGLDIKVASSNQTSALGGAILGAIAAGSKHGGYDSYEKAIDIMTKPAQKVYKPNPKNQKVYNKMFENYVFLHDFFGRENPSIMKKLKYFAK